VAVDQEGRAVGGVELPGHNPGLDQPRLGRLEEDVWQLKDPKHQRNPGNITDHVSRGITGRCLLKASYPYLNRKMKYFVDQINYWCWCLHCMHCMCLFCLSLKQKGQKPWVTMWWPESGPKCTRQPQAQPQEAQPLNDQVGTVTPNSVILLFTACRVTLPLSYQSKMSSCWFTISLLLHPCCLGWSRRCIWTSIGIHCETKDALIAYIFL